MTNGQQRPALKILAGSAFLLALVFAIYIPVLSGGFIWDDDVLVSENLLLKSPGGLRDIWFSTRSFDYFPMTLTSFWFEWRLWGLNAAGYHVVNVLLHGLGAALLWRVLLRLRIPGAFVAAAIFAVHPVNVGTAAWIAERKNTLSMVFFLLSWLWFLRCADTDSPANSKLKTQNSRFYFLSLGAFVLALLSKTSVVVLPFVLLLCVWWRGRDVDRRDLARLAPFLALGIAFGFVTLWFQKERAMEGVWYGADPLLTRWIAGSWAVWFYLFKALAPVNLMAVYPRWEIPTANALSYLPGAALLALFVLLWLARKRVWAKPLLIALAYFVIALGPILGAFNMSYLVYSRVADHWQYLAIIGVIALVAGVCARVLRNFPAPVPISLSAIVIGLLGFLSWQRAGLYRSEETLWTDNLKRNPKAWVGWNNLGVVFSAQDKPNEAAAAFNKSLRLKPDYPKVWSNYGVLLSRYGRHEEALEKFDAGLRIVPNNPEIQNNVADVLIKLGRYEEAIPRAELALGKIPDFPQAHYNLGNALYLVGKVDEAAAHYQAALKHSPGYAEVRANLGRVRLQQGRFDEALGLLAEAARQSPNDAAIRSNLGIALARKGKFDEALSHLFAALKLNPNIAEAHFEAAMIFLRGKRNAEAIEHLRAVVRLEPDWKGAMNNLAWLLATSPRADLRKPAEALELATQSLKLAGENADSLDTLAAAQAANEEFAKAVENAGKALALAQSSGRADLAKDIESRLKLYRANQPYIEN